MSFALALRVGHPFSLLFRIRRTQRVPAMLDRQPRKTPSVLEAALWGFVGGLALVVGALIAFAVRPSTAGDRLRDGVRGRCADQRRGLRPSSSSVRKLPRQLSRKFAAALKTVGVLKASGRPSAPIDRARPSSPPARARGRCRRRRNCARKPGVAEERLAEPDLPDRGSRGRDGAMGSPPRDRSSGGRPDRPPSPRTQSSVITRANVAAGWPVCPTWPRLTRSRQALRRRTRRRAPS